MSELWRRLRVLFRRDRFDRDLEEEMRSHLEMRAEENRGDGMDAEEARYAAMRQFGNATRLQEKSREMWGWAWLERLGQDVRYAFRMLGKYPGFSTVVVLVLALGIGGSTVIFGLVNALILNPFPYPQSGRLVDVQVRQKGGQWQTSVCVRDFLDWRQQNTVFEEMATYGYFRLNVTGVEEPERMIGGSVTFGFLRVLGVHLVLGRFFTPAEDVPGGPPVAVLSYALWQRQFGGRADALGRKLTIDGRPHTIIGVMPARFVLPGMFTCEFWRPAAYSTATRHGTWWTGNHVIARLKTCVSLARAQAGLAVVARRLAQQYPERNPECEARVTPIGRELAEGASQYLLAPIVAVGLVLIVACANLAGLLLARGTARAKEMAVRASLGAGRGRLVRQMLTETVLLSLAGGTLGLIIARWGIDAVIAVAPPNAGLASALRIDNAVLGFAFCLSVVTGVCFGLAPAAYGSKPDLNTVLKGAASASAARPRSRFLSGLVVTEVALAVVLLAGGGLLLKSFSRLFQVDLGIRAEHLLTFQLGLSGSNYQSGPRRSEFYGSLLERLRAIPGVVDASAVSPLPLSGEYSGHRVQDVPVQFCRATPGYFRTMGVPVVVGREFGEQDQGTGSAAVIINQALVRRFFPDENPVGHRINGAEIIGVVGNVRHNGPAKELEPQIYRPFGLEPPENAFIAVRTAGDPAKLATLVRREVHALDHDLPLDRLRSMEQVVSDAVAGEGLISSILSGFGVYALALAALGIYGVIAYSVSQRTHEMGIRVALGASSGNILVLVVRRGLLLVLIGVAIGLPAALAASRVIASLLYGVSPHDVPVFASVVAVLLVAALAACYIPARRAARIDPMKALRHE